MICTHICSKQKLTEQPVIDIRYNSILLKAQLYKEKTSPTPHIARTSEGLMVFEKVLQASQGHTISATTGSALNLALDYNLFSRLATDFF